MARTKNAAGREGVLRLVAPVLRAIQLISPGTAAAAAERLFFRVPPARVSLRGQEFLARGERFDLLVDGRRVVGWSWGTGATTYLVHGWGGSSGRIYPLGEALIESGRRLVMFDAPGHGASGSGLSSMPEFARALMVAVDHAGSPDTVVAHSMGASATALATAWGLEARRFVFVAPAANPADWAVAFGKMLGLSPGVMQRLRSRSEHRIRFNWDDLDTRVYARRMASPLLVIHDRGDPTVPFTNGKEIARSWPGAQLIETSGLGHSDILRDPAVIAHVLGFLADGRTHPGVDSRVQKDTAQSS
jgi:pimeloyl-ACP methyl ester carboxylesterase